LELKSTDRTFDPRHPDLSQRRPDYCAVPRLSLYTK
jgi:hypothetical protein